MDVYVQKLTDFFLEHPVWIEAAKSIKDGASSRVFFSHVPGEWHLLRKGGKSLLREGPAPDPDLAFRFTPGAVERLTKVQAGHIGDFAVELFACIASDDSDEQVGLRVLSSFGKLLRRGYVQVLLRGGPQVLAYGASRGIRTLTDLRRMLKQLQSDEDINLWSEE